MRLAIKTIPFTTCFAVLLVTSNINAQEPQLKISCQSTNLVPFEPILVHVELSNSSSNREFLIPGRWETLLQVEVCAGESNSFVTLDKWWRPQVAQPPLPSQALKPGNTLVLDLGFYTFDRKGKLLFEKDHGYKLRASLMIIEPKTNILSNMQSLWVMKPSADDANAVAELELNKNENLRFYVLPEQIAYDKIPDERDITDFSRRHVKSSFAKYIQATMILRKSQQGVDIRLSSFRKEIDQHFYSGPRSTVGVQRNKECENGGKSGEQ